MKYIMFIAKIQGNNRRIPIIFPDSLCHIDVAKALKDIVGTSKVCSAGEINIIVISTHGESTTIGIKAKEEDAEIINNYNYFHGIEY
jgi:hypothetical protein